MGAQQWQCESNGVTAPPSPSAHRHWLYADHSELPELSSRDAYRQRWSTLRIQGLQDRIAIHQPNAVIFYSFGYLPYWNQVANAELQPALSDTIYTHRSPTTLFLVLKHPVATGITSDYFHQAGQFIRLALARTHKGALYQLSTITPEKFMNTVAFFREPAYKSARHISRHRR